MKLVFKKGSIAFDLPGKGQAEIPNGEHEMIESPPGSNKFYPKGFEDCVAHSNWWFNRAKQQGGELVH